MNFQEFKKKYEKVPVKHYPHSVSDKPLVSVCVITYNHASYIKDCLEGILMQETDYPFEILLGEDDSNDGTREICIDYAQRYPHKIRLFLHHRENNIKYGGQPTGAFNGFYGLFCARGNYIALCEGDDYWIDPKKLQKQFNFMESNSDCSLCFTAAKYSSLNNSKRDVISRPRNATKRQEYTLKNAIYKTGSFTPTASIFFRQKYVNELPTWFYESPVGDMPLTLFLGTKGNYGYIDDVTCVYRKNSRGSWSANMNYDKRRKIVNGLLNTKDKFNEYTNYQYNTLVKLEKARIHFNDKKSIVKRAIAQTLLGRKLKEWFDL